MTDMTVYLLFALKETFLSLVFPKGSVTASIDRVREQLKRELLSTVLFNIVKVQAGSALPVAIAGVRLSFQQQLFDIFRGVQVVKLCSLPPLQPADT